jgi:hypothetical protein
MKSGNIVKNPRAITNKINPDANLISDIVFDCHITRASNGDKGISIDGEPRIPCNLSGKGNMAAPNIEKENVKMIKIGITFNLYLFAVL